MKLGLRVAWNKIPFMMATMLSDAIGVVATAHPDMMTDRLMEDLSK